ncbi:integrase core domain-containing protein [Bradyrhizobium sp. CB1015]|nr:integrase core domain-containing protein [Bradyrhizobium sp. CB1015]UWU90479.1 integrase core domain-containing protein [Bradyrhizobium sp. CB1015]
MRPPLSTPSLRGALRDEAIQSLCVEGFCIALLPPSSFGGQAARTKPGEHPFEAMLLELGIKHRYTRPYRPQTNGKVERFWRTLDDDVIDGATFDNLDHFANELFEYLVYYNNHRPHQALAGQTPKAFAATKTTAIQSAN